jgi:hypothetical protein
MTAPPRRWQRPAGAAAAPLKFGRDPGPNDPVFFDPDKDVPTPIDMER